MAKNDKTIVEQPQKESFVGKAILINNLNNTATILKDAEIGDKTLRSKRYASACQAFGAGNLRVLIVTEQNEAEVGIIRKNYKADF